MNINFFLAGFGKCGSTSLHRVLSEHPDIYLPGAKDQGTLFEDGYTAFKESLNHDFYYRRAEKVAGYTSVLFSGSEAGEVAPVLGEHYPEAKCLFIARDPVARMESEFRELHRNGSHYGIRCPYTIGAALREVSTIVADSAYFERVSHYRQCFPDGQIKILLFEDYANDPRAFLDELCEFLELEPFAVNALPAVHANRSSTHYYDTLELRAMRDKMDSPELVRVLNDLPAVIADQLLPALGLREQFGDSRPAWEDEDVAFVVDALEADVHQFLRLTNRKIGVWPQFASMLERGRLV